MNFLITGGASGLGFAISRLLARHYPDGKIYFTFFSSEKNKMHLETEFANAHGIKCNFLEQENIADLVAFIEKSDIDVLINNALTGLVKQYAHKLSAQDISASFAADVLSTIQITNSFIGCARKKKAGKIITILSAALEGMPPTGWSVYTANKNYLLSMHKSWAVENKNFCITSNCISPGFMATSLHAAEDERVVENMIAQHPLKKLLTVEEVADTVLYLCAASQQINAQNIIINAAQF
jgi:NAD(P)-dependent dehydrogenase (short-subunit alcohol dehydrogenase family)